MDDLDISEVSSRLRSSKFLPADIGGLFSSSAGVKALIGKNSNKVLKLSTAERVVKSSSLVYCSHVRVYAENNKDILGGVIFEVKEYSGELKHVKGIPQSSDKSVVYFINDFVSEFSLRFSGKGIRPRLSGILIYGHSMRGLEESKGKIADVIQASYEIENKIEAAGQKISDAISEMENIEDIKSDKEAELNKLSAEVGNLKEYIASVSLTLSQKEEKLKEATLRVSEVTRTEVEKTNNCQQLSRQEKLLNDSIADKKKELSNILNDRNLISDEFKDYVGEGKAHVKDYSALLVLIIFIVGMCIAILYDGARDILVNNYKDYKEVLGAFILRIPFASVVGLTIAGMVALAKILFDKIIKINEERLSLAKLLVVAKDTTYSTADDLKMSEDEKFKLRAKLKLDMLKLHLVKDIGDAPAFSSIQSKSPSVNIENDNSSVDKDIDSDKLLEPKV